jgi:hypothetical protein
MEVTEEWLAGSMDEDGEVDVAVEVVSTESGGSPKSRGLQSIAISFGFLENMGDEEKNQELDGGLQEGRKRRRKEEKRKPKTWMFGVPGWECREKDGKGEERWKRELDCPGQGKSEKSSGWVWRREEKH